ncbi:hypothetical protein HAX54_003394 [Datura stramonium]|uniref:RNase H type-1 domain-containing protein n=1 Tax=Datura stramonium TaxID=4076 RepID=A0ABS8T692_DATST|nr:hypothetical protein [Datura stramonium]
MVELEALMQGLQLTISYKFYPIEIKIDSTEILEQLEHAHPIYESTIEYFRLLLRKLGNPPVRLNFQQANKVAVFLATQDSKLTKRSQTYILQTPPVEVENLLKAAQGVTSRKVVSLSTCNKLTCFENQSAQGTFIIALLATRRGKRLGSMACARQPSPGATSCTTRHCCSALARVRQPSSQSDEACAAAHSPRDKACNASMRKATRQGFQDG